MFAQFPDGACLPVCPPIGAADQLEWFGSPCICTIAQGGVAPTALTLGDAQRARREGGREEAEQRRRENEEQLRQQAEEDARLREEERIRFEHTGRQGQGAVHVRDLAGAAGTLSEGQAGEQPTRRQPGGAEQKPAPERGEHGGRGRERHERGER